MEAKVGQRWEPLDSGTGFAPKEGRTRQSSNIDNGEAPGEEMMETKEVSVVEALRQAHVALRKDLAGLEQAACSSPGPAATEMFSLLEQTRANVLEHFRFEEMNGYMDAVLQREPNLARTVENLREDHRRLAQALDALIERTKAERPLDDAFRNGVRLWIAGIRQHESDENSLVQDAFNVDFAAED